MIFYEALEVMKRGEVVSHAGKKYTLMHLGIHDVTDESAPERVQMTPEEWDAMTSTEVPETVAPEVVDEVLHEENTEEPTTLGTLDEEKPQ